MDINFLLSSITKRIEMLTQGGKSLWDSSTLLFLVCNWEFLCLVGMKCFLMLNVCKLVKIMLVECFFFSFVFFYNR